MKTRSRILYAPPMPLRSESLAPQHFPASLAGALLDAGHETQILDLATLEVLSQCMSPGFRASCRALGEAGRAKARARKAISAQLDNFLVDYRERLAQHVLEVLGGEALDFLAFYAGDRAEYREAYALALALRKAFPSLPIALFGGYADHCGALLLEEKSPFSCALIGEAELGVVSWAESIRSPELWVDLPNLCLGGSPGLSGISLQCVHSLDELSPPCYDAAIYPALASGGKLLLFALEQSRGGAQGGYGSPTALLPLQRLRLRSPRRLCAEIATLKAAYGARAFHLFGEATPAGQVERFSYEVLGQGLEIRYSRSCAVDAIAPGSHCALSASGCVALEHQVHTGSQRLLEDFYGQQYGVSQIEQLLRGAVAEKIFCSLGFTYPVSSDDYHTVEESLRLIRRCRPDAVRYAPAMPWPGSRWYQRAQEFGFRLNYRRFHRWLSQPLGQGREAHPLLERAYRLRDWNWKRVVEKGAYCKALIEEEGVALGAGAREGLVIRVLEGKAGAGHSLGALDEAFQWTAITSLRTMVEAFNQEVSLPRNAVAFPPFKAILEAVGN